MSGGSRYWATCASSRRKAASQSGDRGTCSNVTVPSRRSLGVFYQSKSAVGRHDEVGLVAAEYVVGIGALWAPTRVAAALGGAALALVFWAHGQDFGSLTSGHATDPNAGPPLVVMALAISGLRRRRPSIAYLIIGRSRATAAAD